MEIHGSSINYSALRPSPQTAGKVHAVPKQPDNDSTAYEQRQTPTQAKSETPVEVEKKLAVAGLSQFSSVPEKTNQSLDIRKLNAINAYTDQSNLPLLEQRAQLLVGIDLYV